MFDSIRKSYPSIFGAIVFSLLCQVNLLHANGKYLDWNRQTDLPGPNAYGPPAGLLGLFLGVHGEAVIVAGGAEIDRDQPQRMNFHREIMVGTDGPDGKLSWRKNSSWNLDRPLAYGLSISLPQGVLCIGGKGESGTRSEVALLAWDAGTQNVTLRALPHLPVALDRPAGALADQSVLVAGQLGGQRYFYRMDISPPVEEWKWDTLPAFPGPARTAACAGVQNDGYGKGFYFFGGRSFHGDRPLNDAWRYDLASRSWMQVADVVVKGEEFFPLASAVVPSGVHHLLAFGSQAIGTATDFRPEVLAYHTVTNTWAVADTAPEALASSAVAAWWQGDILLGGGGKASVWQISPVPAPSDLLWLDYAVIVLYLVILVWMGAHFIRRGATTDDYFKAGKRIPWWAAGISIFATSLSAITYMAVPAKAYGTEWTFAFLSVSQVLTVPLVIWLVLPFYRRLNITTAYEYLEMRFHVAVRVIGGMAFLLFQFGRIGIVLFLPAIALSVVTGVPIETCIIVMAILSIFYTVLGGIEAVIWTDVKQTAVLAIGAIVCLFLMASGVEGGFDTLVDIGSGDGKLRLAYLDFDFQSPTLWVILGGGIGTNLINQTSDQSFVQRYLTTKTEKAAAWGLLTPAMLVVPVSLLFFGLGTALYGFYKTNPEQLNPVLENADAIFPWYIITQLPQGLSGLLIAGIFAASMSSLDSSLNSAATVITVDFYKRFVPRGIDKHYLAVARITTILVGIIGMGFALLLAGTEIKSLWDEFSKILGLFAGGLAGLFLLGMSSKRATTGGALLGFLVSAGIQYWVSSNGTIHFLLYTFTGLFSCYVVGWLASWLFPKREDLHELTVGSVRKMKDGEGIDPPTLN